MTFKNLFILSASLFLLSCTEVDVSGLDPDIFTNSGGGGGGGSSAICNDVDAKFSVDVLPVFADKCAGSSCHTSTGTNGNLNLDDDDDRLGDGESGVIGNIKSEGKINAFAAAQSSLLLIPLASAEGGQSASHTGGAIFANKSDANYKKILCWIDAENAENDLTTTDCSFGEHVYPIFRKRGCTAGQCHDSSTPASNMNLSQGSVTLLTDSVGGPGVATFAKATLQPVFTGGDPDSLLLKKPISPVTGGTTGINHMGGQVFANTQDPDYQIFKCWIDNGGLNN